MGRPVSPCVCAVWAALAFGGNRVAAQAAGASGGVVETAVELTDGTALRYGIATPAGTDGDAPRPLVLVLHPGDRGEYYGSSFMQSIVEPALRSWGAVMVAPDVPDRS